MNVKDLNWLVEIRNARDQRFLVKLVRSSCETLFDLALVSTSIDINSESYSYYWVDAKVSADF